MNCSVPGCDRPHYAKSYCNWHWQRWRRYGDVVGMFKMRTPNGAPRAWIRANVNYSGDKCLIWPFARTTKGWAKMNGRSPARMMCELVNGPPSTPEHQAAHSCGMGHEGCLSPRHLRWATPTENSADKTLHGTMLIGEMVATAKLTKTLVIEIRNRAKTESHRQIADTLGISRPTITRVINGSTWSHVEAA